MIFIHCSNKPYIIQDLSQEGLYDNFGCVSDSLTPMILLKYKTHVTNGELQAFLRVRATRVIRGSQLTFLNVVAQNKDALINLCILKQNCQLKQRCIDGIPPHPVLLEPELYHGN